MVAADLFNDSSAVRAALKNLIRCRQLAHAHVRSVFIEADSERHDLNRSWRKG